MKKFSIHHFVHREKVLTDLSEVLAMAGSKHGKRGQKLDVEKVIIHAG